MDQMTQSAQISSSQGLADGQNSAAQESTQSDKRVVLGSDESYEGVATSLHLTSQPGSFTLGDYGLPDGKPEATLKTSLVSERVKALEALANKKKQPDFTSDGPLSHVRDYRHEQSPTEILKSPTEKITPTIQKRDGSTDQDPLDFPFENVKQWSQYEETEEWMKVHLPPVPDLDDVDLNKDMVTPVNVTTKEKKDRGIVVPDASAVFVGNPRDFIESPVEDPKMKTEISDAQKEPILDSEFEFDLSFLPTPCTWDQTETIGSELPSNHTSVIPASPAPTTGFDSPSHLRDSEENVLTNTVLTLTGKLESPETSEADSSGESHDTVIEDGVFVPLPSSDPAYINEVSTTPASAAPNLSTEKETPPPNSKKKLMQVPTINVIETDEPNYSEEEMEIELEAKDEDFKVVKHHATEVQKTPETDSQDRENEPPRTRPLETEFVEGYSPPSSPLNSDTDQSPEHKILKSLSEMVHQESASKPEDLVSNFSQEQSEETQIFSPNYKPSPFIDRNEVGFPNDESDEAQNTVKPCKADSEITIEETNLCTQAIVDEKNNTPGEEGGIRGACFSKTNTIHSDTYMSNSKECFFSDQSQTPVETLNTSTAQTSLLENFSSTNNAEAYPETDPQPPFRDYSQNPFNFFESETHGSINEQDFSKKNPTSCGQENMTNGNSQTGQKLDSKVQDTTVHHHEPQGTSSSSVSESTDSFADFMQECLKTRKDKEEGPSKVEFCTTGFPLSQSPSSTVMELKQEQLTISALKELGSSQGEEEEVMSLRSTVSDQDGIYPTAESTQQSPFALFPNPPGSQSKHVFDSTGSKEIEAIDEWVAEAYHLAKHVLAILSHVSVKDLIHWRDPKKSGLVFGVSMLLLLSLAAFSVISVVSYLLLALLCVTITFRIYKSVIQAVQKSSEGHPFKALIDKDVSIPPETFRKHVDSSLTYINQALKHMSHLFLVEDLVDSLKLAVVMWLLTYVGAVFNGITILILADILLFSVPPIYERNKSQIDHYLNLVSTQVNATIAKLQEKLPGAVKHRKTE